MNQAEAKKILQDLVKRDDLGNRTCADCSNPNPQWASLSFAVLICLQCAGVHRGFGVHISFVRSISMDTWQEEQIKRMQIGGNKPFREFMRAYSPAEQGGYVDGQTPRDTYHCWAATQYRQKLDSMLAGQDWSPSPPTPSANPASPNTTSQGLRKSRASSRAMTGNSLRSDSSSPASFSASPRGTPDLGMDQKTANESYFASLGNANASRPDTLPPSQGGRYQGFGSTPSPSASHPSFGMSSASAPSFNDLQENPMAALSKGWSLFSAAVVGASRAVNENVIQPGMEKIADPALQENMRGYLTEAQKRAATVGSSANQWSKNQFGVDVADSVGSVVGRIGGPSRAGYGSVPQGYDGESSSLYADDDDAFFGQYSDQSTTPAPPATANKKKDDWDEDWKDF